MVSGGKRGVKSWGGLGCRRTATGTQEELRADAPRGSQTPPGVLAAAPLPRVRVLGSPAEWGAKGPPRSDVQPLRLLHTRLARAGSPATVPRSRAGPKRGGKGRGARTSKVLRVKTLAVGAEGDLNSPRWPF